MGSLKGKPGITVLVPQDKDYRKEIADLAYSAKVDEASKAADMINALIIRDSLKSPSDWMAHKDDIANSLYPAQRIEVESISGNEIILKGGAKATCDKDFQDASKRKCLSVWKLSGGRIPVTSDKPASLKYSRRNKTGSYEPTQDMYSRERFTIMLAIENAYAISQVQKRAEKCAVRDVYLEYTLSLINFVINGRMDDTLLYERILPFVSLDKIDIYLLLEPHKPYGPYLLDDVLIHDWWINKQSHPFNAKDVIALIETKLDNASGQSALIYTDRKAVLDAKHQLRSDIMAALNAQPRKSIDAIAAEYTKVCESNSIKGTGPIFPGPVHDLFVKEPGLYLMYDELRYYTFGAFAALEAEPRFDMNEYNEIINFIGECMFAQTAESRNVNQRMLNSNVLKHMISPTEKIEEILIWVNSTCFMYTPMTKHDAASLPQKNVMKKPSAHQIRIYNIAANVYNRHERLLKDTTFGHDLANILKTLNVDTLDPELRKFLAAKFAAS
jgi:hypothetical protein